MQFCVPAIRWSVRVSAYRDALAFDTLSCEWLDELRDPVYRMKIPVGNSMTDIEVCGRTSGDGYTGCVTHPSPPLSDLSRVRNQGLPVTSPPHPEKGGTRSDAPCMIRLILAADHTMTCYTADTVVAAMTIAISLVSFLYSASFQASLLLYISMNCVLV